MDPALLNYIQSLQGGQMNNPQAQMQQQGQIQGMQPQQGMLPQGMQPQQGAAQPVNNPFDVGISNAIESARQSLGMTQKQQDKALRSSMLTFANNMSQQPRERGFFNNFASIGRAMSPAIATHDAEEEAALIANNQLANQILAYQRAEQDREAQGAERDWRRGHAEAQLAETRRAHDMMNSFRENRQGSAQISQEDAKIEQLANTLNIAEKEIEKLQDKGFRGRTTNILSKFVPGGGMRLTPEQAEINTIGDALKGTLFNAWGYRNQAEFAHVPTISADNPPEVNKAIIKQLKAQFGLDNTAPISGMPNQEAVLMQDAKGEQYRIPAEEVEGALNEGLELIE